MGPTPIMRLTFILLTLAFNSFAAGPLMFGVRGGLPFTNDSLTSSFSSLAATKRYEVGPTVGLRLPLGFSVEGDALFNRESLNPGGLNIGNLHYDSWQFPVMLKF